ncbi:MAG TPA: aldo/keto reductase [Thermoanaerobaculia bacterium]|nr:aldo/keto reductase [Thermoanaerobaculia bacterium]
MRTVRLGRTGVQVPAVSLGTWGHGGPRLSGAASVGWSGNDDELARQSLVLAARLGITHWDTADVYGDGHAEQLIGTVWETVPRDSIFLATKVGWDRGGYSHYYHPRMIRARLERSLRNLATEAIDLYYLHHCDFGEHDEYFDDAIALLRRFRDDGKIRFIGLSDWKEQRIMRFIQRADPDVVQPYRNVIDDGYEGSGLRQWVDANDLGVAFFSPLKHGLLLGKYDAPQDFPVGDVRREIAEFHDPDAIERMREAAGMLRARFRDEAEPVLYALVGALLADAPTGCVLLGQRTPKQVEAASRAGAPLSAEEAEWVRKVYAP